MDVLKVFDASTPEQVISVPKIPQDSSPHSAVFGRQLAEQLVEVPTAVAHFESLTVLVVRFSVVVMDTSGSGSWSPPGCTSGGLAPVPPSGTPEGYTPPAQGCFLILGKDDVVHCRMPVMDVPVIMQFQQSFFETVEVPQTQFLHRLPDSPVATHRHVLTVQSVQKTGDSTVQRVAGRRSCELQRQVPAVHPSDCAENRRFRTGAVLNVLALVQKVPQIQSSTRS